MKSKLFYLLLAKNSSANKAELETGNFPYPFKSNGHRLRNYRIYGADGGVGNYDSETDKYIIPITVAGKNVLDPIRNVISRVLDVTVNQNGSVTVNGTATARVDLYIKGEYRSTENFLPGQDIYTFICTSDKPVSNDVVFSIGYNITTYNYIPVNSELQKDVTALSYVFIRIPVGVTLDNVTFYPMICSAGFSDHDFEPYYNKTTNIILDEPLAEDDYIDFREQQRFNADSSSEIISLPALYTVDGTNIISVDTTVQPEKIYIQGNIEGITLVQVQTLNVSSLPRNTQQLDEIDRELALDVMPVRGASDGE